MRKIGRRVLRALVLLALVLVIGVSGCSPRPPVAPPPPPPAPPATPSTPSAPPVPPAPPRPAPWAGVGLAEPYITPEGNLELVFADARGTVIVNANGTKVDVAVLSPDRQMLAYATETEFPGNAPVFIVDATTTRWQQRELRALVSDRICELSWSPCGRYLLTDSGTSAVRALAVVDVAADALVAALTSCGSTWAWAPGAPTRLAAVEVSRWPVVPITELSESADLVVVDLPSGRTSVVATGTADAIWGHPQWLSNDRLRAVLTPLDDPERATTAEFAAPPVKSGPIPAADDQSPFAGSGVSAEISAFGEVMLVNSEGAVVRRLSDREKGGAGDAALCADGKYLAYTWVDTERDENSTLVVLSLPELKRREIDDAALAKPVFGALSAAPGGEPLALYQQSAGDVLVLDLAGGRVVWRGRGMGALWLEAAANEPTFVVGLVEGLAPELYGLTGSELSLAVVRPLTGKVTVVKAAQDGVGYWPVRLLDGGASVECVRVTNGSQLELVKIALPR